MTEQKIFTNNIYEEFYNLIKKNRLTRIFLVCGKNVSQTTVGKWFVSDKNISIVFQNFSPNPSYESIKEAVDLFKSSNCDCILAIGGGSAMDVAKCIKAFASMDSHKDYLKQEIKDNSIPYYAIPTTAGTGSEATHFAVIYVKGEKKSVESPYLKPQVVFMDGSFLRTLPLHQKKAAMLDALCHGVESLWSLNATEESKTYARKSLNIILENYRIYLEGDEAVEDKMLFASYYAGKAINISKTTAAHAMCYKLTKLYGLPHGYAAAICLTQVWEQTWHIAQLKKDKTVLKSLQEIADVWGCNTVEESIYKYCKFLENMDISLNIIAKYEDIEILTQSVNMDRLRNHPVTFSPNIIKKIFRYILKGINGDAD